MDLCIVGVGAVGMSLARELVGAKQPVLLLEAGGFDFEPQMQDLYRGENVGLSYYPLNAVRLHDFGGTTGHWVGFCSTFDRVDFEQRALMFSERDLVADDERLGYEEENAGSANVLIIPRYCSASRDACREEGPVG